AKDTTTARFVVTLQRAPIPPGIITQPCWDPAPLHAHATDLPTTERSLCIENDVVQDAQELIRDALDRLQIQSEARTRAISFLVFPRFCANVSRVSGGEMTVLVVSNQKGGVGKTTTAISLGAAMVERGQRVLIVDLDPQANATSGLGISKERANGIYGVLL